MVFLMCADIAQMWKRRARSLKCFVAEVGCVCSKRNKAGGKGKLIFGEVVGRVSGVGELMRVKG